MKKIAENNRKTRKKTQKELLLEAIEENTFYSKMAMSMAEHVGCMALTLNTVAIAREKGKGLEIAKALFTASSLLFTLDSAEVMVHELKKRF